MPESIMEQYKTLIGIPTCIVCGSRIDTEFSEQGNAVCRSCAPLVRRPKAKIIRRWIP